MPLARVATSLLPQVADQEYAPGVLYPRLPATPSPRCPRRCVRPLSTKLRDGPRGDDAGLLVLQR